MGFRRFLFASLLALLPYCLASQENSGETASYLVDYSSGTPRFIQRLSWYPEEYASFYELRIEKASSSGTYTEVLRTSTAESHIDMSLPPGLYRYRVQAYDLFEKPAGDPPWIPLEILPAPLPASKGSYWFSAGYKPLFSLYGELNEMLDAKLYPLGFGARFWGLPFRLGDFDLGFEAAANYGFLSSDYSADGFDYRVTGHFAGLALHAVIQKQFSKRLFARLHAGGGIVAALDFKKESSLFGTEAVHALFPSAGAGLSVFFHFSGSWFAILSLEYLHLFSADKTDPGYFSPYAGIGIKL
jgi:hypothetical protein